MKLIKKRIGFIIILCTLAVLVGCAGIGDYHVDLIGNYSIVRSSAHQVTISPKKNEGMDNHYGSPVIPSKVIQVGWDEQYILAKQVGLKQDPDKEYYDKIPDETYEYFWINDTETNDIFGPMFEEQYINKKEQLSISNEVELTDIQKLISN